MNTSDKPAAVQFLKRKRNYLFALPGVGLLQAALYSYGLSRPSTQLGFDLVVTFMLNLALLGWCYADSEERMVPITRFLGLALLAIPWFGVPWYFLRSRGLPGAAKGAFGLGLFALWITSFFVFFVLFEVATGHVGE